MDRREALKKLAAGGAVALGASTVVSSRAVAFAASGVCLGPLPDRASLITPQVFDQRVRFRVTGAPTCSCGDVTATYTWAIEWFSLANGRRARPTLRPRQAPAVRPPTRTNQCGRPCTAFTPSPPSPEAFLAQLSNLRAGDQYEVDVMIEWSCGGESVLAHYRLSATHPNPPTVTQISPP